MSFSVRNHESRAESAFVVAVSSPDADVLQRTLSSAGIESETLRDIDDLCALLREGCDAGCAVVAEECLDRDALARFRGVLAAEPSCSELPVVVMTYRGGSTETSSGIVRELDGVARVTFLERPVSVLTITSAVRAALQSRGHQYRVRDTIEKLSRAEASLKESEVRLRLAVGSGPVVLFGQDSKLRYTWTAHPIEYLGGGEVLGKTDEEVFGAEGRRLEAIKRGVLERGAGVRTEHWHHLERGWTCWDLNLEPRRNDGGKVVGLTGVAIEITERKLAERDRERAEARLRAAVDGSGIGVFEYDVLENRLDASDQCWRIVTGEGVRPEEGLERWNAVVHPEDREGTQVAWTRALDPDGDGTYQADYRVVRKDGSTRWLTARGKMNYEGGRVGARPVRLVGTVQDVTRDRTTEERLRVLTGELEQRVAARTETLKQRTNQLRKLANQLVSAEQRERERLAQMLHDHLQQILAAAKIQLDLVEGRFEEEELNERLNEVQSLIEEAVTASRSLSIELSPPALRNGSLEGALRWQAQWMESHHRLRTDIFVERDLPRIAPEAKVLLYEAVRELLFNVVKHAEVRSCALRLFTEPGKICVSVEDDGKGFDPQTLEERGVEGYGLFSTRERVEAVGGSMEMHSAPGKGSTFRLYVPAIEIASTAEGPRVSASETGRRNGDGRRKVRLLVVDDHPIVRDGLVSMLRKSSDMEVVGEAADGEEAVDLAELLRPDVIVMDVNMPGIGGLEATRVIKRRQPEVNIVGLSIQRGDAAEDEMIRAGASAYLTKGGRSELLFETLRRVAND